MKKEKYNIGLDIGTTSVGWAIVGLESNNILKKGKTPLWGVRLFDEAESAANRRVKRSTRRRYDRRRKRIKLLQEEFKEEINKVDSLFFIKLKQSFYSEKDLKNKTIKISNEEKRLIKNINIKYPTIYHLRNKLINNDEREDIRLVYLAIHHIIKYRGNFLYGNDSFNLNNLNIEEKLKELFNSIFDKYNNIIFDSYELDYLKLNNILFEKSKIDKKKKVYDFLSNYLDEKEYKLFIQEFSKAIVGYNFSINKLFDIDFNDETKIEFSGPSYDEKYNDILNLVGDKIEILDNLKELYDMLFLKDLFKGRKNTNISSLMVDKYNEHKNDLSLLKKVFKYDSKLYNELFKEKDKNKEDISIYRKYVNNKITYDDFIKEIDKRYKTIVNKIDDSSLKNEYEKNEERRINQEFLPRITDNDNGKYPYQLNKDELIKIIDNQGKYYPFLKDTINDYNTGKQVYKLVALLSFRIPYYVGPLNNTTNIKNVSNENYWALKKNNNIITPYNFYDVIDIDRSAELFIERMTSNCTYLINKKVIPNYSILYSEFKVLNELKQININGKKLDHEIQRRIYNDIFLKKTGKITCNDLLNYLRVNLGLSLIESDTIIDGFQDDKKFANNMQSYIDFFGDEGLFKNTNYNLENAEEIIKWVTIFEDKKILERKIKEKYVKLSNDNIKKILSLKYKGWSNLSKELLTDVKYYNETTKKYKSIIDLMRETNENFMQIITNKDYKFQEKFDKENNLNYKKKINYSLVDELPTSPSTKKGIYQALKVIDEIVRYIGYKPEHICIEMARNEEKKERTVNKKKYLTLLYENNKENIDNYRNLIKELKNIDEKDLDLKYFLYFIQEGKSLYSGKPIDIDNLAECEIDHIIPRSLIKDDSIDNKALVFREENQIKSANLVVPSEFRTPERKKWWEKLEKNNLISLKKKKNLIRNEYNEKDIEGFINRQIVETRQITKHVANILNHYFYSGDEDINNKRGIIYINANISHNYREKFELYKLRELNDYHHAHDAYLAAVLGEYYNTEFKHNINIDAVKEMSKELYNKKMYKELGYGIIINSISNNFKKYEEKTGEIISDFDCDKFNELVCNNLYRNDILVSFKTEINTGELYNETKQKKGEKGVPLKKGLDTDLYGSYTSLKPAYLKLIKYNKKKKIIGIPIYYANNSGELDKYIRNQLKIKEGKDYITLLDKIPFNTMLEQNNHRYLIISYSSAHNTSELCNAKELKIKKMDALKYNSCLKTILSGKNFNFEDNKQLIEKLYEFIFNIMEIDYECYHNTLFKLKKLNDISLNDKCECIKQMIIMMQANSKNGSFKFLNSSFGSSEGRLSDKSITSGKLIFTSVTGVKQKIYSIDEEKYEF